MAPKSGSRGFLLCSCVLLLSVFFGSVEAKVGDLTNVLTGSNYENVALLDGGFELFWSVNSSAETIHMAARAKTKGWLAVGISEIGSMVGSDVMVGWVQDGTVYATDRFIFDKSGEASGIPLDAQQDWCIVGGHEEVNQFSGDTWTTIHVWRKLKTGDCNDRDILPGAEVNVIWATGTSDELSYHGSMRGSTVLVLAPAAGPSIVDPPAPPTVATSTATASNAPSGVRSSAGAVAPYMNLTFASHAISTNQTTYMCQEFNVPYSSKVHLTEWGVILNSTVHSAVHHAVVYGCYRDEYANIPPSGRPFDCLHEFPCRTTVAVWAMGGRPFTFPDSVGYPVGPGHFTKLVLQMHYTNPEGRADLVDNSGVYFKVDRRPTDAAIMLVGPIQYDTMIQVPAGQPSWTQTKTCPGACTEAVFKNESVKIIGSILHMHTLGRQLYTDIYRGGDKFTTINRQDYYDFASQQTVRILPEIELLPGDELRTTCVWDSAEMTEVTMGGPGTYDEMCIDYIMYYPAKPGNEMNVCMDFCASYENDMFVYDPDSLNLTTFYVCGIGANNIIPSNKTCSMGFGENKPLQALQGCLAETKLSVSDFPRSDVSLPVTPSISANNSEGGDQGKGTSRIAAMTTMLTFMLSIVLVMSM